MYNDFWINKKTISLTIKINDLCNTSCLHCYSSGKDKSYLDFNLKDNNLIPLLKMVHDKGIRNFDIALVGGEMTILSEDTLKNTIFALYLQIDKFLSTINNSDTDKTTFIFCFISNFIFDFKSTTHYNDLLYNLINKNFVPEEIKKRIEQKEIFFNMMTSYEIGLNRFKMVKTEEKWKENCLKFKDELHLLVTLNKETCISIDYILTDKFFKTFESIIFQPMLNFSTKNILLPDYKLLYETVYKIKKEKNIKYNIGENIKPHYMISINNDGNVSALIKEKIKLFNNDYHFNLSNIEEEANNFSSVLDKQLESRKKKTRNKNCISCEFFENCDFGFEFFESSIPCPAFKIDPKDIIKSKV